MNVDESRSPGPPLRRVQLQSGLDAPRQARAVVREALAGWGLDFLSNDAQLLASELVANSAEHGDGTLIGLTIRQHTASGGRPGILCQITDNAPALPRPQQGEPDAERGRGLQIVSALAASSGVTASPGGKTTWFTLTAETSPDQVARPAEPELELEP